jgi:hypothetical protein
MNPQPRSCQKLIASVVAFAVLSACSAPPKRAALEVVEGVRLSTDTLTALRFLFDKRYAGLNEYAEWLDFDADHFRSKIVKVMYDDSPFIVGGFEPMQRRNFRYNYTTWYRLQLSLPAEAYEDKDDD